MSGPRISVWFSALALLAAPLAAQERGFLDRDDTRIDPPGAAARLGLSFESGAILEWTQVTRGEASRDADSRYVAWSRLGLDLDKALGLQNTEAFFEVRGNGGTSASDGSREDRTISGLDAADDEQISELGIHTRTGDPRLRARLGILDANSEFAALEAASNFLDPNAGTSPTILGIPTWPATAPGAEIFVGSSDELSLGVGAYAGGQAAPLSTSSSAGDLADGIFAIGELGWACSSNGRLAIGAWHSAADYERADGTSATHAHGAYALAEQRLCGGGHDDHGVFAFALFGHADPAVAEIRSHLLCGLTWRGPLPRREDDEVGVMISRVDFGHAATSAARPETTSEVYYRLRVTETSSVQLGAQHVRHPAGDSSAEDLVALGLRVEARF